MEPNFKDHNVFAQLKKCITFYNDLIYCIDSWKTHGTYGILNLDSFAYESMVGTLESITSILLSGRINDAYALLRKYYDATVINVYCNIFIKDNFNFEAPIVAKIDNWVSGKEKLPEYRVMSQYIHASAKLNRISSLILQNDLYKNIRSRCNDHTHYNYFKNVLLNNGKRYLNNQKNTLSVFLKDLNAIFIQHLAYTFYINDHYLMSTDYMDSLDMGVEPLEGSQFFVAPFVQDIFDSFIKIERPDIAAEIKLNTKFHLN